MTHELRGKDVNEDSISIDKFRAYVKFEGEEYNFKLGFLSSGEALGDLEIFYHDVPLLDEKPGIKKWDNNRLEDFLENMKVEQVVFEDSDSSDYPEVHIKLNVTFNETKYNLLYLPV